MAHNVLLKLKDFEILTCLLITTKLIYMFLSVWRFIVTDLNTSDYIMKGKFPIDVMRYYILRTMKNVRNMDSTKNQLKIC